MSVKMNEIVFFLRRSRGKQSRGPLFKFEPPWYVVPIRVKVGISSAEGIDGFPGFPRPATDTR